MRGIESKKKKKKYYQLIFSPSQILILLKCFIWFVIFFALTLSQS